MTDLNATWDEKLRGPRMSESTGRVIFKYQMPIKEQFHVELPRGAKIIRVQDLDGMFWLWAIVDTNAPMEKRYFRAFKTGAKIPDDFDTSHYLGMCAVFIQMELGLYIFEDTARWNEDEDARVEATLPAAIRDRFQVYDAPVIKGPTIREIAQEMSKPVVDVKLSETEPSDMAGLPYILKGKGGTTLDWPRLMSDMLGYNIYEKPPEGTLARHILDIDDVLSKFKDVFFTSKNNLNQTQVDIEEARMEDEDDA